MKKHIVFVIRNFNYGGVERQVTNLGNKFFENGYDVSILVMNQLREDISDWTDNGIDLIQIDDFASSRKQCYEESEKWIQKRKKTAKRIRYFSKQMKKTDFRLSRYISVIDDCIAIRTFLLSYPDSIYIAFNLPIFEKLVYSLNGTRAHIIYAETVSPVAKESDKKKEIKNRVIKPLLKKADYCVFQNHWQEQYYKRYIQKKKSCVIYNPIKENLPKKYEGIREKTIVNFCRYAPEKNLFLLTAAFDNFSRIHPDYLLDIYGVCEFEDEKQYYRELKNYTETLSNKDKIRLLPAISDIHSVIRNKAMFVSSSDSEGLSNSMLEALAIGLPCICTDCSGGGAKEMIGNKENGLLVPTDDVDSLCSAMVTFAENPDFAEQCANKATEIIAKTNIDTIARQWISLFESI